MVSNKREKDEECRVSRIWGTAELSQAPPEFCSLLVAAVVPQLQVQIFCHGPLRTWHSREHQSRLGGNLTVKRDKQVPTGNPATFSVCSDACRLFPVGRSSNGQTHSTQTTNRGTHRGGRTPAAINVYLEQLARLHHGIGAATRSPVNRCFDL